VPGAISERCFLKTSLTSRLNRFRQLALPKCRGTTTPNLGSPSGLFRQQNNNEPVFCLFPLLRTSRKSRLTKRADRGKDWSLPCFTRSGVYDPYAVVLPAPHVPLAYSFFSGNHAWSFEVSCGDDRSVSLRITSLTVFQLSARARCVFHAESQPKNSRIVRKAMLGYKSAPVK
jgi:hypothetical protein